MVPLGCPPGTTPGSRSDTRATISGVVRLQAAEGAQDMSRVRVDLGRGEGTITPDADGSFNATDLEPDVYTVNITYAGGLLDSATGSAYAPFSARVVARAGNSSSLGTVDLPLGKGTVRGTFTQAGTATTVDLAVRLLGEGGVHETVTRMGRFEFTNVTVGRYVVYALRAEASGVCGTEVVVAAHEQVVELPAQTLADGVVALTPLNASTVWNTQGNVWFLKTNQVTVQVTTAGDAQGRAWLASQNPPATFQTLESGLTLSNIPAGRTRAFVQIQDPCGQQLAPLELSLVRDDAAPLLRVDADSRSPYITTPSTRFFLTAVDDFSTDLQFQMAVCDGVGDGAQCTPAQLDPTDAASWRPLEQVLLVTFSPEDGPKEVRLRVRDQSLNVSELTTLGTRLDRTAPTQVTVTLDGVPSAEATVVHQRVVRLVVHAQDETPMRMRFARDATLSGAPWQPILPVDVDLGVSDGPVTLYVQLQDDAGNTTAPLAIQTSVNNRAQLLGQVLLDGRPVDGDHANTTVSVEGTQYTAQTAQDGTFSITGIPAGTYSLQVTHPGYRPQRFVGVNLVAPAGLDVGVVTLLQAQGRLTGTVVLEGQTFHGGVTITLNLDGGGTLTSVSDGSGVFNFPLTPGTYNGPVEFHKDGFGDPAPYVLPAVILQDQAFNVGEFTLIQLSNELYGQAVAETSTGDVLEGIEVQVLHEDSDPTVIPPVLTSSSGSWRVPVLPLGLYRVVFRLREDPTLEVVTVAGQVLTKGPPVQIRPVRLRQRFVQINGGADSTRDRVVTLGLSMGQGCNEVEVSSNAGFTGTALLREGCAPTKTVTLPAGDGEKTVYARFYSSDAPTVPSLSVEDSIILDTVANFTSCTASPTGSVSLGTVVTFLGTTGAGPLPASKETGGTMTVAIAGYVTGLLAHDDGLDGDAAAGDGIYSLRYRLDVPLDVNNAALTCSLLDRAGNTATKSAGTLSVRVPPLITGVRMSVDTQIQQVRVEWETDEETQGTVLYGPTAAYGQNAADTTWARTHAVTFSSASLDPGLTYHFAVTATDRAGNTAQTPDATFSLRASVPSFVAAIPGNSTVWVRWEGARQNGLQGYHVYRSTQETTGFARITPTPFNHEVLMYEDASVTNNTRYFYRVTTVDGSGTESFPSTVVNATPGGNMGPTHVGASVVSGTTEVWSPRGSPYLVDASVFVEQEALLVIGPGVEVVFPAAQGAVRNEKRIRVEGRIAVLGTRGTMVPDGNGGMVEDDTGMVVFRSDAAVPAKGDWGNIILAPQTAEGFLRMARDAGIYVAGNVFYRFRFSHFGASAYSAQDSGLYMDVTGGIRSEDQNGRATALYVAHGRMDEAQSGTAIHSTDRYLVVRDVLINQVAQGLVWSGCEGLVDNVHVRDTGAMGISMQQNTTYVRDPQSLDYFGTYSGQEGACERIMSGGQPAYPYARFNALLQHSSVSTARSSYAVYLGNKARAYDVRVEDALYGIWGSYTSPYGAPYTESLSLALTSTVAHSTVVGAQYALQYLRASNLTLDGYIAPVGSQPQEVSEASYGELYGSTVGSQTCTGPCGVSIKAMTETAANVFLSAPAAASDTVGTPALNTLSTEGLHRYNHFWQPLRVEGLSSPAFRNAHKDTLFSGNTMLMTVNPGDILVDQVQAYAADLTINMVNNAWGPVTTAQMNALVVRGNVSTLQDRWDDEARAEVAYIPYASLPFPLPTITSPYMGQRFYVGDTITLAGSGTDPANAGPVTLTWLSQGGTPLGTGASVSLTGLTPGEYKVFLVARSTPGQEARVPIWFHVWPDI
jgi:fibronectin type 3 domain-containing protein